MKTIYLIKLHLYMSLEHYKKLLEAKEKTGKPIYIIVNFIIVYMSRLLRYDFDLKVKYEEYLFVSEGDKKDIRRPYVKLFRNIHFFVRNIKNRNFRSSIAMIVRIGIDEVLDEVVEDILSGKVDESIFAELERKDYNGRGRKTMVYNFRVIIKISLTKCCIKAVDRSIPLIL